MDTAKAMNTASSPANILSRFAGLRVLCVGDVMLDHFVYGSVERISPEAPVPVLKVERETWMPGGAGNVARNLAALGASTTLASVIGTDSAGHTLATQFADQPGLTPALITSNERPTSVKMRHIAGGQQMLRSDRETRTPIESHIEDRLCAAIADAAAKADVIILSDYAKGVLTHRVLSATATAARKHGIKVVADPKSSDLSRYRGVHVLTPNARELAAAAGMAVTDDNSAVIAARKAMLGLDLMALLVTRSEHGMTLVTAEGQVTHLPAMTREVFDVSGAGDTVIATLAVAMAAGATLQDAASLANIAAGIVVGKAGTAVVHPDEIAEVLQAREIRGVSAKIRTQSSTLDLVQTWRARGLKVGFTNGCFDLIHPGHISLLAQARSQCDRLVVGLNTDQSVRRLKGLTRPINSEVARAVVLAALESVDAVTMFDEDTPIALITLLRPDVLVKGADYSLANVVGADQVVGWGGRVFLAELTPGQSTSGIVSRMAGDNK